MFDKDKAWTYAETKYYMSVTQKCFCYSWLGDF